MNFMQVIWPAYAIFWFFRDVDKEWVAFAGNCWKCIGKKKKTYGKGLSAEQITLQTLVETLLPQLLTALWKEHPYSVRDFEVVDGKDDAFIMSNRFRHRFDRFVAISYHNANPLMGIHDHGEDPIVYTDTDRYSISPPSDIRALTLPVMITWTIFRHSEFGYSSGTSMTVKYHGHTPQLVPNTWTKPQTPKSHSIT